MPYLGSRPGTFGQRLDFESVIAQNPLNLGCGIEECAQDAPDLGCGIEACVPRSSRLGVWLEDGLDLGFGVGLRHRPEWC